MAKTMTEPHTATASAKSEKVAPKLAVIDYVSIAKKDEDLIESQIGKNPIYRMVIDDDGAKEEKIAKIEAYLLQGMEDNSITTAQMDEREKALVEFNSYIQVVRKQLGTEQAKEITGKAYADFQRIVNDTSTDVARFEQEINPFGQLADLFSKFGAEGNIIEKINIAKEQKKKREEANAAWQFTHDANVSELDREIRSLEEKLAAGQVALAQKSSGVFAFLSSHTRLAIEADNKNVETELATRRSQLVALKAETLPQVAEVESEESTVDEDILKLQNIGGPDFKEAVLALRDHTEEAMAKMSTNFGEAIEGLTNTRESFVNMDRSCGDANFALSVLTVAVKQAETKSRQYAEGLIEASKADGSTGIEELERMEKEQRSEELLSYTDHLTTFLTDIGVAVASLRSGQAVIKNILHMNKLALQSANTHKLTGIANTADAVTITIGSILEVCNRAASRALADGLTRIRDLAEEGNARLTGGTYESLQQQNEELQSFIESVSSMKDTTMKITADSIDLIKKQFALVAEMNKESALLGAATTDSERAMFAARSGVDTAAKTTEQDEPVVKHGFGLKVNR